MRRAPATVATRNAVALAIALAALVAPVVAVRWPPLLDYPNHYARMWLLAGGAEISPMSEMYRINWHSAATNIGIDVITAVLRHVLPVSVIGPIVVGAAVVLPPLGAACLNRAVFGGTHWWQVVILLLAWSTTFIAGFLNFQIGLGVALLGAAVDPLLARRGAPAAAAARLGLGALALAVHALALPFYAALVGALAVGPRIATLRTADGARRAARAAVVACLPVVVPLVLVSAFASTLPGAHVDAASAGPSAGGGDEHVARLIRRAMWQLATPFVTYSVAVDAVFAAAFALPLALALAARRLAVHGGLLAAAIVLALLSTRMPGDIAGTHMMDKRLPPMVALAFAASVRPLIASTHRTQSIALAVALLTVTARTSWMTRVWAARHTDVASVERALARVPSGAAVLPMEHRPSAGDLARARAEHPGRYFLRAMPTYWHLPALAIVERHAFVPTLFTAAGKQPVEVLPPWDEISVPEGKLPPVDRIGDPKAVGEFRYLARWRERFDFLLVVNADVPNEGGPLPGRPEIQLVADEGFARLYRIDRRSAAGSPYQ